VVSVPNATTPVKFPENQVKSVNARKKRQRINTQKRKIRKKKNKETINYK
jgi:hypothetical protein